MLGGDTPLIDAVRHGRAADVAALLAGGADVSEPKTDGSGNMPLQVAGGVKAVLAQGVTATVKLLAAPPFST